MVSMPALPTELGRYRLMRVIGRGSMGAVFLARDPTIDREVAIKLIQTSVELSPSELAKYTERFYREAKAAGKLLHPGIVTVFDVGHSNAGAPFIVMEYVRGRTLKEMLEAGALSEEESCSIASQLLDALGYAHARGVVHRDIKPANILITSERQVKIMDFGVAHLAGSDFTQSGDLLGSPWYMAPEQFETMSAVDQRTDLWGFGVVFYEMLTGERPFGGSSLPQIAHSVAAKEPVPLARKRTGFSPGLSEVVLRCLQKDPARRYPSADEVKKALIAPKRAPSPLEGPSPRKSRRSPILVAALVTVLGLVSAGYLVLRRQTEPSPSPPAASEAPPTESTTLGDLLPGVVTFDSLRAKLPLILAAQHRHRIGDCRGKLTLEEAEVRYESQAHGQWRWTFGQILAMKTYNRWHFGIETAEEENLQVGSRRLFKLGEGKTYNFELLDQPMEDALWAEYSRMWKGASTDPK